MTPRILVTGGTGLLGSYLLRWFKKNGYTHLTGTFQNPNVVIPPDLQEGVEWRRLMLPDIADAFDIIADKDWVIHSAGLVSYFKEDKYRMLEVNQKGTEHIVNACLAHNIEHLIYIGSIGAIGKESKRVTLNESNGWLNTQFSTSYGLSKYLGELEVWRGVGEGLNASVILPSVILGTGDWQRSSLQLLDRVAKHSPYYPGGQTGYVDARDIAAFCGLLLEKSIYGERWILSGANLSFKDIYQKIAVNLGIKRKYREAPEWLARTMLLLSNIKQGRMNVPDIINQVYGIFTYDTSKTRMVEGFQYRDIDETIKEVVQVYKQGNGVLEM